MVSVIFEVWPHPDHRAGYLDWAAELKSSYVDSVLAEGERIVYRAHISRWKFFFSYLLGILFLAAAVATYAGAYTTQSPSIAAILLVVGLVVFLSAAIRRWTTELAL